MGKKLTLKKVVVIILFLYFITTSFLPTISGEDTKIDKNLDTKIQTNLEEYGDVKVKFYTFGLKNQCTKEITIPYNEVEELYDKITDYSFEAAIDPESIKAKELQQEIFGLFDEKEVLPEELTGETLFCKNNHFFKDKNARVFSSPILESRSSAFFCNFITTGTGSQFPIIIFPRLIPILQLPIPRLFLKWNAIEGVTSCGGLLNGKGYIATGQQQGLALGFWGIGFSVFLPPIMQYGFLGYALYSTTKADDIELWPPNYTPEASAIYPPQEAENIPISTSELQFHISDANGDLMDYIVTTNPDIGSGSGTSKTDGTYSIPISGLEGTEEYHWTVKVTDGEKTSDNSFSFTTEPTAPIVYDPDPENGEKYVSIDQSQLQFTLKDIQGDTMDYTVETVPNVGSGSGSGVGDGTYSVPISGLEHSTDYNWFVNVTDGEVWKHKIFYFQTEPIMEFDPFDEGWQYRKEITINHTLIEGDHTNFPILLNAVDTDLAYHAQNDGDDLLFMDGIENARRLYHEIEMYDGSSGEIIAWVNITSLSSTEDTLLWMYYGNPSCGSQQHPIPTWDSGYEAVWHMNDATISSIIDSTLNENTGIKHSPNNPLEISNGKIGNAQDFERDNNAFIDAAGTFAVGEDDDITLSAWVNVETHILETSNSIMSTMEGSTAYYVCIRLINQDDPIDGKKGYFTCDDNSMSSTDSYTDTIFDEGSWYYFCGVLDRENSYMCTYKDGVQQTDIDDISDLGSCDDGSDLFFIGAHDPDYGLRGYYDGILDELRVSNVPRTSEWILTGYNNQNNPYSFLSFGPEEYAP